MARSGEVAGAFQAGRDVESSENTLLPLRPSRSVTFPAEVVSAMNFESGDHEIARQMG